MAASGSGGEPGRPWTATSTWSPAGGGAVEDAVSFETTEDDAEESPAGVVLSRPPCDHDGDSPPCEVTVSFRGMYEIHRVYVRSTARTYEIYQSTDTKGTSKDYLCTVRCGLAVKERQPSVEESTSQWSAGASTSDKRELETKSVSSSSDEDSWVDVKIPEPMGNNTSGSQERNTIRICQENTLTHYEATAEMTDVSPCVSLTVRLLSLQSKTSVHIEEIYIFADPVESTNDNSVTGPGNMGGSSLLAMLVPGLMQLSKSRNLKIDDNYLSDGSRTQLTQDRAMKDSNPSEKIVQGTGLCCTDTSKFKPAGIQGGVPTDSGSGTVSNEKRSQGESQFNAPNSLPLPLKKTENTQVPSGPDQRVSKTDQLVNPLTNENFIPCDRIERKMDTLLSKLEKIELYCSRFEDITQKPLCSIEERLQRLEQQFDSFSMEIQSLRGSSARMSAPDGLSGTNSLKEKTHNDGNVITPASVTHNKLGSAVRAPDFPSEYSSGYNVTNEAQISFCGPNVVPRLLVKVPDFISNPELTGEKVCDGPSSSVESSVKERKTSPGLVITVPEFPDDDDDDDDEVEEQKEAEFGEHDDGHTQYNNTLNKSTAESSKRKPVSINGALASALEALLSSNKGTPSSKSVVCTASNLTAENTIATLSSLCPENFDETSTEDVSTNQFLATTGNANLVASFRSYQEIDGTSCTSLSEAMLDGMAEVNEQNNNLNSDKSASVASTESLNVPSQPHRLKESTDDGSQVDGQNNCSDFDTMPYVISNRPLDSPQPVAVFESVDNGAQVNKNRPAAISLAEFLAARNASSCKDGTSEVCCSDHAEKLSFERTSSETGKDSKNINQLLVKKALEVDADDTQHFCSVPIGENFEGSRYVAPRSAANGPVSDKGCGLENEENSFRVSVGMNSIFSQYSAGDSKKKWVESGSSDWSLDESFSKPNAEHSWSNLSVTESCGGEPANDLFSVNITSEKYVQDLLDGTGFSSTATPIAGEELQKFCDLLYEYKDDMLGTTSRAKGTWKSSPSLEVLLGESSDSEVHVSDLEDIDNGVGISSAGLLHTLYSSDDGASSVIEPLTDVADPTAPSEPYAATLNEPLINVADLNNSSGSNAPLTNEPLADDVFDPPNPSELYACGVDERLVFVDDMPKSLEAGAGGNSGEHPESLI